LIARKNWVDDVTGIESIAVAAGDSHCAAPYTGAEVVGRSRAIHAHLLGLERPDASFANALDVRRDFGAGWRFLPVFRAACGSEEQNESEDGARWNCSPVSAPHDGGQASASSTIA
jgi:hypothetical protein